MWPAPATSAGPATTPSLDPPFPESCSSRPPLPPNPLISNMQLLRTLLRSAPARPSPSLPPPPPPPPRLHLRHHALRIRLRSLFLLCHRPSRHHHHLHPASISAGSDDAVREAVLALPSPPACSLGSSSLRPRLRRILRLRCRFIATTITASALTHLLFFRFRLHPLRSLTRHSFVVNAVPLSDDPFPTSPLSVSAPTALSSPSPMISDLEDRSGRMLIGWAMQVVGDGLWAHVPVITCSMAAEADCFSPPLGVVGYAGFSASRWDQFYTAGVAFSWGCRILEVGLVGCAGAGVLGGSAVCACGYWIRSLFCPCGALDALLGSGLAAFP